MQETVAFLTCHLCSKTFSEQQDLERHNQALHKQAPQAHAGLAAATRHPAIAIALLCLFFVIASYLVLSATIGLRGALKDVLAALSVTLVAATAVFGRLTGFGFRNFFSSPAFVPELAVGCFFGAVSALAMNSLFVLPFAWQSYMIHFSNFIERGFYLFSVILFSYAAVRVLKFDEFFAAVVSAFASLWSSFFYFYGLVINVTFNPLVFKVLLNIVNFAPALFLAYSMFRTRSPWVAAGSLASTMLVVTFLIEKTPSSLAFGLERISLDFVTIFAFYALGVLLVDHLVKRGLIGQKAGAE